MSSSVCQGLQSCLEVRVVEPRLVMLKLAPIDTAGWSFLQSLGATNGSNKNDNGYVHPPAKRSALTLSEKSLEMCTENLGSETGSEVSQSIDELSIESRAYNYSPSKPRESSVKRKTSPVESFPPPLTSITGSNGVKVKSHREDGRLVLQAVSIPPCNRYFHADRSEGRVRLSIFKDPTVTNEEEVVENDDENGEVKEESLMREVRIWKEIVRMLGVKLRQGNWADQAYAKKAGVLCSNSCLIGSHCWWGDYVKPTT